MSKGERMRYFSSKWHGGELTSEEEDEIPLKYQEHLDRIVGQLPGDLRKLSKLGNLHDAIIRHVQSNRSKAELSIHLTSGYQQVGYRAMVLTYMGVPRESFDELRDLPSDRVWEVLYDEVDLEGEAAVHRMLFWPYAELVVVCSDFKLVTASADGRGPRVPPFLELTEG